MSEPLPWMAPLRKANQTRLRRADLRTRMGHGDVDLAWVFRADKEFVRSMTVYNLLLMVPRLGPAKASRALGALGIKPRTPLSALSGPRRAELLRWLKANCPKVQIERQRS